MFDKLFYTTCGMFNSVHFLVIVLFFALLWLLLRASRKLNEENVGKLLLSVAIFTTVLEIIKIAVRINGDEGPDSWVPLYFCSLFIPAIWLAVSPWQNLRTVGFAYLTMGGIAASVFFIFYPSTALGMYPLFHLSTIHSVVYHLIMCYCGILILQKRVYTPHCRDAISYSLFIIGACILAVIVNKNLGTNCMFLEHPFGLPFLMKLCDSAKPLYMLVVAAAQSVGVFYVCFGIYSCYRKRAGLARIRT